jgi:hypothetical protein
MRVLVAVLRRRLGPLLPGLGGSLLRTTLAAAAMGILLLPLSGPLAVVTNPAAGRSVGQALWLGSAVGWAVLAYLGAAAALGSPEILALGRPILARWPRLRAWLPFRRGRPDSPAR